MAINHLPKYSPPWQSNGTVHVIFFTHTLYTWEETFDLVDKVYRVFDMAEPDKVHWLIDQGIEVHAASGPTDYYEDKISIIVFGELSPLQHTEYVLRF